SHTQYFQFRIIDDATESSPSSQYEGDFWGLYIAIEQPDGRFLDERGLDDGNIFNMHGGTGGATTTRNQGSLLPTDRSDLASFISSSTGYRANHTEEWWRDNVNLESYFAWYAINLIVNNSDLRPDENVNYYHNQVTGQWYTMPWDLDLTFEDRPHLGRPDTGWEALQTVFSRLPGIKRDFDNYVRNLQDLLLDNGQAGLVFAELANVLTGGQNEGTIVQANQAQWDYHPRKNKKGIWYKNFNSSLLPEESFEGLVAYMQDFVTVGGYGYGLLDSKVTDADIPAKPNITYTGPAGFPKNGLSFETSSFNDPQGAGTFGGMQWRLAEVHDPSVANYDPRDPYIYEIEGTWESDVFTSFDNQIQIPTDQVEVGKTYRVRVRMMDASGNWSHWSEANQFQVTVAPPSDVAEYLRISEVNYNPATDADAEFIELTNISSAISLDLSGVAFTSGPSTPFVFPSGTTLNAGEYLVVVRDQLAFQAHYPSVAASSIAGEYQGGLSNSGEKIELQDNGGNVIVSLDYSDGGTWSQWADGHGGTLVLDAVQEVAFSELGKPYHWRGSTELGGSPAAANASALGVVINEILAHTDPPLDASDAIELLNTSDVAVDVSGWYLSDAVSSLFKFEIPDGTVIPAGGYVVFDETDFNPTPGTPGPNDFALSGAHGDDVWLVIPSSSGGVGSFVDEVHFQATQNGETLGRTPDGTGRLLPLVQSTLGCENGLPRVGPVIISEIQYHPDQPSAAALSVWPELVSDDLEFVELYNPTNDAIDLTEWQIRGGIELDFAAGTILDSGAALVVISFNPDNPDNAARLAGFRAQYGITAAVAIVDGYSGQLTNRGEVVRLERPDSAPLDEPDFIPHFTEDEVVYDDVLPWPTEA
ncbi:MAG: lamin tail domain-containing protein, partial [Planctomycetales bacterium]|nr:lamin tail domain-containing protein [Planctomycetales bacterium]